MLERVTTPGGNIIMDEADPDGLHHGRVVLPGETDGDWLPVCEEAPTDDKTYARQNGDWVPLSALTGLYQGTWQPAANVPDIGALTKTDQWMWCADTVDPAIGEVAPAGLPGIGGLTIMEGDHIVWAAGAFFIIRAPTSQVYVSDTAPPPPLQQGALWWQSNSGQFFIYYDDGTSAQWVEIGGGAPPDPYHFGIGLSIDDTTRVVDLQPAGPVANLLGGVYVPIRDGTTTGLAVDIQNTPATGELLAPPASDLLLGTLTEPPTDGLAYSRQWDNVTDPANPVWKWVPALTAGLQITSIIPDKAIYGPGEPLLTVHAYGSEFTDTCVIRVDGSDATTAYASPTELTFVLNPAVPINEQFHIITVHETAPAPVDGLGAEQFDFIKASTEVDYGTGLSLDTGPTPPIVHLDPAGPTNLGGVIVSVRDATTQGLVIDMGDGTGADPATGELWAPPATPDLLGTILEPPSDDRGYIRRTDLSGVSAWVPPALPPSDLITDIVAPTNVLADQLWLNTETGKLYVWYVDNTAGQGVWVQMPCQC